MILLSIFITRSAPANGGPFVLKYPNGDPAAKGVLARIDPDLKPGRENRLRVIKEELKVEFGADYRFTNGTEGPPKARVVAEYTIENPTSEEIEVDFGFPILRGIYISPFSMVPRPAVEVSVDGKYVNSTIISNSAIYGIIRQRAHQVIEDAVSKNLQLQKLVEAVRAENTESREAARRDLLMYLTDDKKWNPRDAALMVEYAGLNFKNQKSNPLDRYGMWWTHNKELNELVYSNLGPLSAIGEQKATQFFAQLASVFDPEAASAYEAIFTAWGGDVRERSIDLKTGKVRPREVTVDPETLNNPPKYAWSGSYASDPTIYARVDYLDPKANITESEKESCKAILKNLPVIFTFAPMNILYYQAKFPAQSVQKLTVSYSQYAYSDTASPESYQLAYVVHPASFWQDFGPINLEVAVPKGVGVRASVPGMAGPYSDIQEDIIRSRRHNPQPFDIYKATITEKTGELYLAVNADQWKKAAEKTAMNKLKRARRPVAKQTR